MKKLLIILLIFLTGCMRLSEERELYEGVSEKSESVRIRADYSFYHDIWQENAQYNEDYVGQIWFDSGLLDLPFVQGEDNDFYLHTDWKTMEEFSEGSAFMDFRNQLDDQNLILYGHYIYEYKDPSRTHMFTPLQLLKEEENYQENQFFNVLLDGRVRRYQVALVYYCPLYFEGIYGYPRSDLRYNLTEFEEEYFNEYKQAALAQAFYDTGVDISMEDKLITFQTCVENRNDLRLIIVAKMLEEIDTLPRE